MQTDKARIMRKLRQSTVEPVLGTLVNFLNMKRINTRGIAQANKHVLMAALAYNLKKYMKYAERERNRRLLEVKKTLETACLSSFSDFLLIVFRFLGISNRILMPN